MATDMAATAYSLQLTECEAGEHYNLRVRIYD